MRQGAAVAVRKTEKLTFSLSNGVNRRIALMVGCLLIGACSGKSSGSTPGGPTPSPGPVNETLSGTTRQTGPGSCGGDSHNFNAQDGEIAVNLLETSDPACALSVQICAGGIDNRDCTINQQRIRVGQTLTGARRGSTGQNLKLLPHSCVFGGPFDVSVGITYRVSLTFLR